jgi:DNA polymerase
MATHLDFETTSACDISLGSYRYASHPSTRILMFAVASGEREPLLWRFDDPYSDESLAAESLLRTSLASNDLVYAHNAQFEVAVSIYRLLADVGLKPPAMEQWRCTQAMCRRAAAPESLAASAEFFGLGDKKNPIGKELIRIFSDQSVLVTVQPPVGMIDETTVKLLKNGRRSKGKKPKAWKTASPILDEEIKWDWLVKVGGEMITVRAAWEMFCDYCRQDVRVEQELHRKLTRFELTGDVLESFQFDLRMNWRGVPVNIPALRNALGIVDAFKEKLGSRFTRMCGFEPGQRDCTLKWLRDRGYPEEDLQSGTVERILSAPPDTMSPMAVEVLRVRSLLSFAALAKIPKMIDAACDDGRVRGTTQWHAARTGRAGGRIIQPQNFKKATIDDSELCYKMIQGNWEHVWFEEFWPSPLEAIASSIRHFIHPHEGEFFDADYTGVEARITPWLAGDAAKLQIILEGLDLYKRMATLVFGIPYAEVTKDQRTICKPIELGCCFGVGGKALMDALALPPYNVTRTRAECNQYVKTYRDNHPETVQAWRDIEEAAKSAVAQPGATFHACGKKLSFVCGHAAGIPYLVMQLPSKRRLYYPHPKVKATFKTYDEEDMIEDAWKREKGGYWIDQLSFYGKLRESSHWGRVGTWGSRLFENAVQAIGADLLNRGCIEAERRGFNIVMIVHDQALAETKDAPGDLQDFIDALCTKDPWAASFPLAASGAIQKFYLKD